MTSGKYPRTERHKKNLSLAWDYDKHFTPETRKKISISNTGKKRTNEHKRKYSIAKKGQSHTAWNKGLTKETDERVKKQFKTREKNGWFKNPEKSRRKMSKAKKGKFNLDKHPNWQGGKSFEPYGIAFNKELKNYIRWMDNHTCQQCGISQNQLNYKLHIHHIDFIKKNNSVQNLISLCRTCHAQTYYNRQDWTNYFQNKLNSPLL